VYMFPTLNVMGHGSHIRWVNRSWVNSNDPLPALLPFDASKNEHVNFSSYSHVVVVSNRNRL